MFISANRGCKGREDGDSGVVFECIQEFILDTTTGQKSFPSSKAPTLLGVGAGSDSDLLVQPSISDSTHEVISLGRDGKRVKPVGGCVGNKEGSANVSFLSDK